MLRPDMDWLTVVGGREIFVPAEQVSDLEANARLVRAADLELARDDGGWALTDVDTRRRPRRLLGLLGPQAEPRDAQFRDWHDFEWLIGAPRNTVRATLWSMLRRG